VSICRKQEETGWLMETMTAQRRSFGYQLSCIRSGDYFLSVAVHPISEAQIGLNSHCGGHQAG